MSFNIKNSFVSRSIVQANTEQTLESDKKTSEVKQQDYDPRTLYERLQEQKTIREEKFAEESRLSNHIKRIDEEEAEYFKILSDEKKKLEEERKRNERLELERYRLEVENARTTSQPLKTKATSPNAAAANTVSSAARRPVVSNKAKNKFKDVVVVKKRGREEKDEEEDKIQVTDKNTIKENETKDPVLKKAKTSNNGSLSLLAAYSDDDEDEE
ncbi:hypothetical protein G6F37_008615 [Rhizopus arrhizus]|nr:hypothetical protein G6F38_007131 [Rhizopus arrhizus]KAG1155353.1 hypothetical protein G6F37_008615 [Rhizopus arrhizus]